MVTNVLQARHRDAWRGTDHLRLVWGKTSLPVRRFWKDGLALDVGQRAVPGRVHLYDGARYIATGLICSDRVDGDEHRFHFKRITFSTDRAPLDYAPGEELPAGLLSTLDQMRIGL